MSEKSIKTKKGLIIFAGFLIMGTVYTYSNLIGLLIKPMQVGIGASRTQVSMMLSIAILSFLLTCPFVGKVMEKIKLKPMMTLGVVLTGISYIGFSMANNLPTLYGYSVLTGIGIGFSTLIPINTILQNWFTKRNGLVTGIVFMGSGIGGAFFTQLIKILMQEHNYRFSFLVLGIVALIVNIPFTLTVFDLRPPLAAESYILGKQKKERVSSSNDDVSNTFVSDKVPDTPLIKGTDHLSTENGHHFNEVRKSPQFALLVLMVFFMNFINLGVLSQYQSYLSDVGYSMELISSIQSLMMIMLVFTKLLNGWLFDRIGAKKTFTANCLIYASAFLVLAFFVQTSMALYLFAILIAFGGSMALLAPPILTREFFGNRDYIKVFSMITFIGTIGAVIGAPLTSRLYEDMHSYDAAWVLFAGISATLPIFILVVSRLAPKSS